MTIAEKIKGRYQIFKWYTQFQHIRNMLKDITMNYNFSGAVNPSISLAEIRKYNNQRIHGPQRKLCNAPFTSIFINITGDVTVCGYNKVYTLGNIKETPLKKIWNNNRHKQLQSYILDYDLSHGCELCMHKIKNEDYHRAAIYYDTPKSDNTTHLRKITFELSNLCNLECIMCNGELSSLIRKNRDKKAPLKLHDYTNLTEQLVDFIPHLHLTQYLGGEPLLIKIYYEIWEKIIALNSNCIISIQTNGMVLPEKFLKLLDSGQFMIGFSIDSFNPEKFESIRLNAKFSTVMNNFMLLHKYKEDGKIQLSINFVPMNINWDEIPLAVNFANRYDITLSMCELDYPYEFSFKSMSSTLLEEVIIFLENAVIEHTENRSSLINSQTYNNQIKLLKHLLLNIRRAELIYPTALKEQNNIQAAKTSFGENILKFPVMNEVIKEHITNNFILIIQELSIIQQYAAYQLFNQYILLYDNIYVLKQDDTNHYKVNSTLESFLLNEIKSVTKTILLKSKKYA